jgi:hypothetical protein
LHLSLSCLACFLFFTSSFLISSSFIRMLFVASAKASSLRIFLIP